MADLDRNPFLDTVGDLPMLLGSFEPDDESTEPGVCICGAYGPAGQTHIAKPSAGEPPEECGRFL